MLALQIATPAQRHRQKEGCPIRYEPLASRVIIEPAEENRVSAGGIVIPDVARNHKHLAFGKVLSVGAGRVNAEGKTVPLTVKPGDVVAFPRKAPAVIPVIHEDGREDLLLMLPESDIVAIVHDMPIASALIDVRGAPLSIVPNSRAKADSAYESEDQLAQAAAAGWDVGDHIDEPVM